MSFVDVLLNIVNRDYCYRKSKGSSQWTRTDVHDILPKSPFDHGV